MLPTPPKLLALPVPSKLPTRPMLPTPPKLLIPANPPPALAESDEKLTPPCPHAHVATAATPDPSAAGAPLLQLATAVRFCGLSSTASCLRFASMNTNLENQPA